LLLTTGAAFAGGDSWTSTGQVSSDSVEAGGPGLLGGDTLSSEQYNDRFPSNSSETPSAMDSEALAESDVIYVYPMQVTEYYLLVPSVDSALPLGG
ncbi:MAG: hypothetical protein ACREVB_15080, partial [Burkholderiales bacterium]